MRSRNLLTLAVAVAPILSAAITVRAQLPVERDLRLWLDATDGGTITTDGGQVTQWSDKSGNNSHATQADPARRPVVEANSIGGLPSIRFDTTGPGDPNTDGLQIDAGLSVTRPYTFYIVDQYWGDVRGRTLQGQGSNWLIGKWGGNTAHFTGDWAGIGAGISAAVLNEAASEGIGTPYASNWAVNGFTYGGNGVPGNPGTLQLGTVGAPGNPPFDEPSQADVSEIILFNRTLADNERNAMSGYLADKFGLPFQERNHSTRTAAFTGADPGEGLDFSGTFVHAVNARGPGGFSIGDAVFTDDAGVIVSENEIAGWFPSNFAVDTPDDGNLNTVMQSIRWTASDGVGIEDIAVNLPNLTPGNTYKLQMLFADTATSRHWSVDVNGQRVMGELAGAAHTGTADDLGVAVVHEFVAQSDTLTVNMQAPALAGGDTNPIIQGLTVEDRGITGITTTGTFSSAADLDFSGVFKYAVDVNGAGGVTVGDAAFTADSVAGVAVGAENAVGVGGWGAPDYGATPDDDALESVMSSIRWVATNGVIGQDEWIDVSLSDLTPGQEYQLQLLFAENCCDRGFDISAEGVLVVDNFSPFTLGALQAENTGAFVSHRFFAEDDTLNITISGYANGGHPDINPILNGFTLEVIPEPGTAGLLALGAAGLLARRRRRPIR